MPSPDVSSHSDTDWHESLLLVADETRMRILISLATASEADRSELSYSELQDRVDITDNGTFNYHLDKLRGTFVEKTDDGYRVTYSGLLAYRALMAGVFTTRHESKTFDIDADCYDCAGTLQARYTEDHAFYVECSDCERVFVAVHFPPTGFEERSRSELLRAVDYRMRYQVAQFARGICSWCGATVTVRIETTDETDEADWRPNPLVTYICNSCNNGYNATVGESLLAHSRVQAFLQDNGLSMEETRIWNHEYAVTDHYTDVRSTDPWRIAVTVPAGTEELELLVDGEMTVRDTERRLRTRPAD